MINPDPTEVWVTVKRDGKQLAVALVKIDHDEDDEGMLHQFVEPPEIIGCKAAFHCAIDNLIKLPWRQS